LIVENTKEQALKDYIESIEAVEPTYVVEIPSGGESISEYLLGTLGVPKTDDLLVLEDSDVCQQTKLSSTHADAAVEAYHAQVTDDLNGRLRSGSLNADFDGDPSPDYYGALGQRIMDLIEERRKILNERINWFTYRVDEHNEAWVDFPVMAYRFGHPSMVAMANPAVKKAVKRLRQRGNVKAIRVTSPVPQHWYHGPIISV
jgi:hypothetical protein